MSATARHFTYDAFISYSHSEAAFVRDWLVPNLKASGLTVCVDDASFRPGEPTVTAIEQSILLSRKTILVLSPEYLSSEWCTFESLLVQTLDPGNRVQRIIPLLRLNCH